MYSTHLISIAFLLAFNMSLVNSQVCTRSGWFGPSCQYKCHCENGKCNPSTGQCTDNSKCVTGWFGLGCQYQDLKSVPSATITITPVQTPITWITDRDDSTCNQDIHLQSVAVAWNISYPFSWLRLTVKDNAYLGNLKVSFRASGNYETECSNQRIYVIDTKNLDISCQMKVDVMQVIISGQRVTSLCSLYISGGRNEALKQTAVQSSTYKKEGANLGVASYAVDGDTGSFFKSKTCTHTDDRTPNWNVTFSQSHTINRIVLYNRFEEYKCCPERLIHFGLQTFNAGNMTMFSFQDPGDTAMMIYTVIVPISQRNLPIKGIRVNSSTGVLTLCEVQAFGECTPGTWGLYCNNTCNHSCMTTCNVDTGKCQSCNGFSYPLTCPKDCISGHWGPNCTQNCSTNCYNKSCNSQTGVCDEGCNGYSDSPLCTIPCVLGKWGINCSSSCSQNCWNVSCDHTSGQCDKGCNGYRNSPQCTKDCDDGYWGLNCTVPCSSHCSTKTCHGQTSECCNGCNVGYLPPKCEQVDPNIQDDLNNITPNYTDQTQTDERPSSSFPWTTTMDTVATPRPKDCPRDVQVTSMGQDSVTFMWRHQAQYDDTEFRIAVFDNASNRIFAPNSPQVSDDAYTYISVTSLDHTTDYRFKIGPSLSNVTEYVCDDELPKIVFCPEDSQEEVTFVQTRGGVTRQVPCPPNYEGNITRTCNHKTGSWTPFSQYNCARKRLIIASNLANDLSNESSEVLKARVKDISSEVTSALEGNITIVSGEIKQIVNILEQIGIASNRSSVSNDTLQRLAAITDKLIEADTSTWDELSSANKTENAGSVLLKAMEDITSSYLHSANVTDTLIQEKNIVITVASTGQGRDNITFPKMDQATYNTNQTLNKVFLSSEALSGSVAYSVIIYMNVSDKFKVHSSSNESSQEQRIGTDVISFSLSSKSTSLSSPLILTFKTGESRDGAVCSFLDTKNEISGVWLSDGCKTILKETTIDCQCSHLTNFAVLMSMTRLSPDHHTILSYISVIGLSISLFFLCLTVTVYSVMWRYVKSDRSVLHINLCVCLMLGYTVFLGGISRTEHRVACAVAAALLHYLFLAVFFVMLSQGLLILKSVTSVSSVSILRYLYIIMYGAPLVIVATSLGITQGEGFGTDKACWLSPQKGVLWAFVGPALSIVVVNFFILFAVIRIMQKSRIMTDKDVKKKTKSVVRSIFILSPILGVTWVLGVLSATMELAIFQYAFAISNSLQGLFIFIFQCVLQYQIKDGFRALLRRYRATSFDSSQRMVSTGQSQEKGYSESGQKTTSITNTSGSYMSKE